MRYENIYFIGIGGIGMSAIARFCKFKGVVAFEFPNQTARQG